MCSVSGLGAGKGFRDVGITLPGVDSAVGVSAAHGVVVDAGRAAAPASALRVQG